MEMSPGSDGEAEGTSTSSSLANTTTMDQKVLVSDSSIDLEESLNVSSSNFSLLRSQAGDVEGMPVSFECRLEEPTTAEWYVPTLSLD